MNDPHVTWDEKGIAFTPTDTGITATIAVTIKADDLAGIVEHMQHLLKVACPDDVPPPASIRLVPQTIARPIAMRTQTRNMALETLSLYVDGEWHTAADFGVSDHSGYVTFNLRLRKLTISYGYLERMDENGRVKHRITDAGRRFLADNEEGVA